MLTVGSPEIPPTITLTPQTTVVRDGARAVRRISGAGTTMTLDAASPGVADIKAGSVVLIRDVVVVKATAVRREGSDVVVPAASVALTDLVRDGSISWTRAKMSFRGGSVRDAPPATPNTTARLDGFGLRRAGPVFALTFGAGLDASTAAASATPGRSAASTTTPVMGAPTIG